VVDDGDVYGRGVADGECRELDGQEGRLRFSLLSADLYSYWID
jgi:hypothetical protein